MATQALTIGINPRLHGMMGGARKGTSIGAYLNAGDTVTCTPHAKAISLNVAGNVAIKLKREDATAVRYFPAGITYVDFVQIDPEGVNSTDAGLGIFVYGDS